MEKLIAYCGLICTECPAFIATEKDSEEEREKVAKEWSEMFKDEIKAEDINCDGCLTKSGRICNYTKICEIRKCAIEKEVKNCAYCDEYVCRKLSKSFEFAPKAKETLEEIRKSI